MAHSEASEAATSTSLMWGRQAGKEAEEEREQVAGEGEGREWLLEADLKQVVKTFFISKA